MPITRRKRPTKSGRRAVGLPMRGYRWEPKRVVTWVNDDAAVMKKLMHKLLMMRVRPYYIYQCDPVKGTHHLRTTVRKGIEIIEALRGHTTVTRCRNT